MAKKRRKQEEKKEEDAYRPPEFDKKEYMQTEITVAKGTIYAVVLAVPLAVLAFLVLPYVGSAGLLVAVGGIGFLWFLLPFVRVDIEVFKPMHWLGIISSYFFMFLALWVLFCNPPFSDRAAPDVSDLEVAWDGGNATVESHVVDIPNGVNITITAKVTDNEGLNVNTVMISVNDAEYAPMTRLGDHFFEHDIPHAQDGTNVKISARDVNDNRVEYSFDLL
jgi:hypothetical protein